MNENYLGTMSMGIKAPILKEGDPIIDIVVNSVLEATNNQLKDKDVIGITESLVARSLGEYVTIDDIVNWIQIYMGFEKTITVVNPIYSRNQFAIILIVAASASQRTIQQYAFLVVLIDFCTNVTCYSCSGRNRLREIFHILSELLISCPHGLDGKRIKRFSV